MPFSSALVARAKGIEVLLYALGHVDLGGDDGKHLVAAVAHLLRVGRQVHQTLHAVQQRNLIDAVTQSFSQQAPQQSAAHLHAPPSP